MTEHQETVDDEIDRINKRLNEISKIIRGRRCTSLEKLSLQDERVELRERLDELDAFDPFARRGRGDLATDVNIICKRWLDGDFTLDDGKYMTPYVVGKVMKELDELDDQPSSGAISAIFKRWQKMRYAEFRDNPFAFIGFTELGKTMSLDEFTDQYKQRSLDK